MHTIALRLASAFLLALPLAASAHAAALYQADSATLAPLRAPLDAGARVRVHAVPLLHGGPETLELEKFDLWAPDAEIKVFGANGRVLETLPVPAAQYFRGRVAGQPDSLVFLSVHGKVAEGVIYANERKFAIGSRRVSRYTDDVELVVAESSILDDYPVDGR
jgi:hypothetical protein